MLYRFLRGPGTSSALYSRAYSNVGVQPLMCDHGRHELAVWIELALYALVVCI